MGFLPNNTTGFKSASGFRRQAGDSSCGCNHPVATNYNPSATANDGSCEFVYGCTLIMADNYNPAATMEDGSCQGDFDFPTYSGSMGQNITFDSYADYMSTYNQGMYASFGVTYPVDEVCTLGGSLGDQEGTGGVLTGGTGVNYDPVEPTGVNYDPVGPTGPNVGDLLDQLADAAGGPTGGASGGSSGGMITDSGASFEKDPKAKKSKRAKQRFSGFAGRDAEGFFKGAPTSQPYVAFSPSPRRAGFKSACGCGA